MINGEYLLVIAPNDYPGKKYRGKYCYEHHLVYWKVYNIIPKDDEIIHHKDENKHHNVPENLELMKRKEHTIMHNTERLTSLVLLLCPGCQKFFIKEKRNTFIQKGGTYTCCSRRCIGITTALKRNNIVEFDRRIANNVIQEFKDDKTKYLLGSYGPIV